MSSEGLGFQGNPSKLIWEVNFSIVLLGVVSQLEYRFVCLAWLSQFWFKMCHSSRRTGQGKLTNDHWPCVGACSGLSVHNENLQTSSARGQVERRRLLQYEIHR